jgi:hypothetical protein
MTKSQHTVPFIDEEPELTLIAELFTWRIQNTLFFIRGIFYFAGGGKTVLIVHQNHYYG